MSKSLEWSIVISAAVSGAVSGISQFAQGIKNASKSVQDFSKRASELEKVQKKLSNMDKARENFNKVSKEYKEASKYLAKLKAEYERSGKGNDEFARKVKEAEKYVNKLNLQKDKQLKQFEKARSKIEEEGHSLKTYRNSLSEVNKELKRTNDLKEAQKRYEARQEAVSNLRNYGDKQINSGLKMAGAVIVPIKLAMDLEESQADLRKIAEFGSKEMETKFYQAMRRLSDKSPLSQGQIFEIAGAGAQAGIQTKELEKFTEDAMKIKVAFDMNTEAAGQFLAKTRSQLGLNQAQVMQYADTINYLADHYATSATEVVDISQRVAGLGGIAGLSKEAVAAFGATLVSSGENAEVAATGLKNMTLALTSGAAATKAQRNAFESMGLDAVQVAKEMSQNGEQAILKVLSRLRELPPHVRAATMKQLFGKESIQSVSDMVNHLEDLKGTLDAVKDKTQTAGSVDKEYANRMNTLKNNLLNMKNQLINIGIDLGNSFAPALKKVLGDMQPVIKKFSEFVQKNPQLTATILKAVAAFALFKLTTGGIAKGIAPFLSGISKLLLIFDKFKMAGSFAEGFKNAFPILSRVVGIIKKIGTAIGAAFAANPVFLIIAGIIAVITVLVILYNKCTWFRKAVNSIFKAIGTFFISIWNGIKPAIVAVLNVIINNIKEKVQFIKLIWSIIRPTVIEIWNAIKVIVKVVMQGIAIYIRIYMVIIKAIWTVLKPAIILIWNIIKVAILATIKIIVTSIKVAVTIIKAIWKTLSFAIKVVWAIIKAIIVVAIVYVVIQIRIRIMIIKALWRGLVAVVRFVWNLIKGIVLAVWNVIKSKATALWNAIKIGITGVKNFFSEAWNKMKSVAKEVWDGIKSAFDSIAINLKKAIDGVVSYFKQKWNDIKTAVANNPITTGFKGLLGMNAAGTNYWKGGLTTVAERGAELIRIPGRPAFLAENKMLLNLPRGTQILNNRETRNNFNENVSGLKNRISSFSKNNGTNIGGDTINITIYAGNNLNAPDIAREVDKVLRERENRKRRVAYNNG